MKERSTKPQAQAVQNSHEVTGPETLKISAAAQKIGCTESQLRKLINRGEGPAFVMIGAVMMIRRSTIEKWLAKREAESLKILRRNRQMVKKFGHLHSVKSNSEVS